MSQRYNENTKRGDSAGAGYCLHVIPWPELVNCELWKIQIYLKILTYVTTLLNLLQLNLM